jgi:outer membrane protein OmpA-like peptidoglycan-associated protein
MFKKIITTTLMLMSTVLAAEQFQSAFTDTEWTLKTSRIECALSQRIDDFGEAKFSQFAGSPLTLVFSTYSQPSRAKDLIFEVAKAPWQNSDQRQDLMIQSVHKGQREFTLKGVHAQQALHHIKEGRFPTIYYQSLHSEEPITVLMSTVHLSDYLPDFQQCLQNILPYSFDEIKKLTVNFDVEKAELGSEEKAALGKIAEFVNADKSIKRIEVSGHTDNHGRRSLNQALSEQRALTVKQYLVEQYNVPENLITVLHFLELKPVKSNKSPVGRSFNRRTEIKVIR